MNFQEESKRMCVNCRKRELKSKLKRYTLVSNVIVESLRKVGRGAYLCCECNLCGIENSNKSKNFQKLQLKLVHSLKGITKKKN